MLGYSSKWERKHNYLLTQQNWEGTVTKGKPTQEYSGKLGKLVGDVSLIFSK